jgi:hypothetical protein
MQHYTAYVNIFKSRHLSTCICMIIKSYVEGIFTVVSVRWGIEHKILLRSSLYLSSSFLVVPSISCVQSKHFYEFLTFQCYVVIITTISLDTHNRHAENQEINHDS